MRVSLVMYTAGGLSGGAAKYLRRMVPRFLDDGAVSDLRVLLPRGALADIPAAWPVEEWPSGPFKGGQIRKLVAAHSPDVVLVPTARWIDPGDAASVVMVRNMEPLERTTLPTKASDKVIRLARRVAARRACERADRVIAVSGHVAHWLKSNWRIDDRRLAVIPHGVDSPGPALRPAAAAGLVGRRFIFSAGSIRPARGLTDLVMAMGRSDFPAELDLAFAGKPDPDAREFHADLLATVARLGLAGRVHWLGQCNSGEMDWGFANCELFVMTSRAEACPNTVLEALANGCLSVSCDTPPMPEFFGPAAIYYASGDPASLSAAVAKALALSPGAQNDRRELARQRASNFSWDSCARSTLDLLSEAVNARALDQGRSR